ncbi:hypothetical protein GDO86_000036 [Hymenochirus boettgeri]|uniref:N-acetyltransferase domain-containing protein n=1 Tax=Hymenochirus boettgeri TaxID=247094 RepID=A0A8T2KCC4_9PIPI|nr:hypothetical protein GDO86_000036 [Hymenochirus boettgeri]
MANLSIRKYRNGDHQAVCSMFASGMNEHLPATCVHLLKLPQVQLCVVIEIITVFLFTRSYSLLFVCLAITLLALWCCLKSEFDQYVTRSLREDLHDIEKFYMRRSNSCFWVAESEGRIVGIVGADPAEDSDNVIMLRRLSVASDQRNKGIARALCMEVIDFATQLGYEAVSLHTSMVQYAAHKLYERLGFKKTRETVVPTLFSKFINFVIFSYSYNIV